LSHSLRLPIANERGEALVGVHAAADATNYPVTFSVVVCAAASGFLLVHNFRRKVWEVPGGLIDPGETPGDCAAREFREETSQEPRNLRLRAVAEIDTLEKNGRPAEKFFGAVYCAEVGALTPFQGDHDIDAVRVFPAVALPPETSAIDAALLTLYAT
jgi:8-oxo-dGTP diphosphatase